MHRLHDAFGPIAGGVMLDLVDLATFGPIGLLCGWLFGALIGWWITSIYNLSPGARMGWAMLCGLYCMIPFTAILPLGTIMGAFARFAKEERASEASTPKAPPVPQPPDGGGRNAD